jgi:FtsZ-interacting cell division protein ZipA
MPKNTSGGKQKTGDTISPPLPPTTNQAVGTTKSRGNDRVASTINTSTTSGQKSADARKSGKSSRSAIGGTAVSGAKSTQPKQLSENANPQQQQMESYNRDMRRRMERMGYNDTQQKVHTVQEQRKKRAERLKQRRQEQISHVKRSLPGGKVDTNTTRVYIMIAVVAVAIILLILVFAFIRHLI